jgi:hypothetical protein
MEQLTKIGPSDVYLFSVPEAPKLERNIHNNVAAHLCLYSIYMEGKEILSFHVVIIR